MSTIEMCKKYYGTADIYKIFGVSKNSSTSQSEYGEYENLTTVFCYSCDDN